MPQFSKEELLATLLVYRMLYFMIPFALAIAIMGARELWLNVVQPWWSPDPVLAEEFIVRYKPGNFADTIAELEAHAKAQGCKALVISSLAQIRKESYGHYLQRKGFREVSREYVKGI